MVFVSGDPHFCLKCFSRVPVQFGSFWIVVIVDVRVTLELLASLSPLCVSEICDHLGSHLLYVNWSHNSLFDIVAQFAICRYMHCIIVDCFLA